MPIRLRHAILRYCPFPCFNGNSFQFTANNLWNSGELEMEKKSKHLPNWDKWKLSMTYGESRKIARIIHLHNFVESDLLGNIMIFALLVEVCTKEYKKGKKRVKEINCLLNSRRNVKNGFIWLFSETYPGTNSENFSLLVCNAKSNRIMPDWFYILFLNLL